MLEIAIIIALATFFAHNTTWEGNINDWLPRKMWNVDDALKKLVYECPKCMAFWWGIPIATLLLKVTPADWHKIPIVLITAMVAAGINTVISFFVNEDKQ